MAEKNRKAKTPFEQEVLEVAHIVQEYRLDAECNIVAIVYKNPEELFNINLKTEDFSNNEWRVFFEIAYQIICVEKKATLDDMTVGFYLEKHPRLKDKYLEYGGYEEITKIKEYVKVENLNSYIADLRKWKAVIELCKKGFPVKDNLSRYADISAEEIYNEFEANLNHVFANIDFDVKSYDICNNIHELIDVLDQGSAIGLPYYNMPILTKETGGQYLGSITLLGGLSNAGKSTVARSITIPSILNSDERIVIMVNEDSVSKWQREMLVWVCNNILHFDIQKHVVRDGHYSEIVKQTLHEAADWLQEKTQNHTIIIIPFLQYYTSTAIKEIKKYAAMGVRYFILDTFKMDAKSNAVNSWLEMQQAMVNIKDVVKAESLNVHILITFQLEKGSSVVRYYTQNSIGISKNIVDVASTCIMIRDLLEDEYPTEGNKKAIHVYRMEGKDGKTKIEQKLDTNKNYQIFFIVKNQEGAANKFQIVAEHDKSRNIIHEIGITNIKPDW